MIKWCIAGSSASDVQGKYWQGKWCWHVSPSNVQNLGFSWRSGITTQGADSAGMHSRMPTLRCDNFFFACTSVVFFNALCSTNWMSLIIVIKNYSLNQKLPQGRVSWCFQVRSSPDIFFLFSFLYFHFFPLSLISFTYLNCCVYLPHYCDLALFIYFLFFCIVQHFQILDRGEDFI